MVSGVVELSPFSSPFTAGVARDGRLIYKPRITLSGLPEPSSLGEFNGDPAIIKNTVIVFKDGVGYEARTLLEEVRGRVGIN